MKIRTAFNILFGSIVSINIIILLLLLMQLDSQEKLYNSQIKRFDSFDISDDLRQSDDDLTLFCRSYVITGDTVWENKYWELAKRRMGILQNDAGESSVIERMNDMGFSSEEFELLKMALDKSNILVETEEEAMNASKGLYKDDKGQYTVVGATDVQFALNKLYDEAYFQMKKDIRAPIDKFEVLTDRRTAQETADSAGNSKSLLMAIIGLKVFVILVSIIAYNLIRKRVKKEEEISEKLIQSEQRFQLAAIGSNAGIWDLDIESGKAYWSDVHYKLLGYEVGEVQPSLSLIRDSVHPDDLALLDRVVSDHINNGTPLDFEARFYNKNKELKWFGSRGASSRNELGKSIRTVGTFSDITDKKQAQIELVEKEQQLQYALDVSNEGIWEWNTKQGEISYSSRCFNMVGYKPVHGKDVEAFWRSVIVKDDLKDALMINLKEIKQTGIHDNICRIKTKSNETRWIHTKGKAVEFIETGKPSRIIGTMSDITKRMKQEEEVVNAILETEDKERSRIARDIHDGLQQTMSTALMSFEKVRSSVDFEDKKAYNKFHQGYQFLKKSIEESRTLAHNLMPKVIGNSGIVAGIESMISAIKGSTTTTFVFEQNLNEERLKLSEEMTFYRIIQESVNNVIKYANAKKCHIQLLNHKDVVILTIEDDGCGFDKLKHQNTFGLNSMKTRADSIGAYFEINSQIGRGTQILVELPINN